MQQRLGNDNNNICHKETKGFRFLQMKCLSDSLTAFETPSPTAELQQSFQNRQSNNEGYFMHWLGVQRCEWKKAEFGLFCQALFFIFHTTTSITFMCTTECKIMNSFKKRLSKSMPLLLSHTMPKTVSCPLIFHLSRQERFQTKP